jgi:nitrate reductase (NAD(P)H)
LGVAKDGVFNNDSFIPVTFLKREELSRDVRKYTFKHHQPDGVKVNTGQHFLCGFKLSDGISARPYAMTRPIGQDKEDGTFDMVVKSYFPDDKQPGGIVSNILDMMNAERGDSLLIMGSFGPIRYAGKGKFIVDQEEDGQEQTVIAKRINLISGGTGMTPIWATIKQILECDEAKIPIRFLDANTDENEILLDDELSELAENFKDQFEVIHILEEPSAKRKCEKGLVDKGKIERHLFKAEEGTITFVCGPPPMLKAAGEALKEVGFEAGKNFFHF